MSEREEPVAPPRTLSIAGGLVPKVERLIAKSSVHGDPAFYDPTLFEWTAKLESAHPAIRAELDALLLSRQPIPGFEEISHDQTKLTDDKRWQTYFLLGYGVPFEDNITACPQTWAALQYVPGLVTAFFSILAPGKSIPLHRGPYKGVLRYHLGMKVPPRGDIDITVGNETRGWEDGKSLVFDDTYLHKARNLSGEERVVLFVDFERPLRAPLSWINRGVLKLIARSGFVQEAKSNYEEWRRANTA
ncbi:aspartyl/asparaginyl beta-hydroxylase domain-containing protein [Aurantiacibacter sp. D1-12]|uniref:aspartyl/asparaginyl beta-hydroxylase domain-containing protein n=1 Tax=Aurantiacibacter sp. D1-12 TaxID=2993658 RepID=UPI00237C8E18|nr:aspartyl/asparaginyl beta-hydroxylase domain-containing protein [Aurantiacibacter sp. D1-12]MDE1468597.1 aspartyl/asparaginyl beta-hydroxylase domain-containing protein [Aurantiacibacter sp. D1-12]